MEMYRYLHPQTGSCRLWHRATDPKQLTNLCGANRSMHAVATRLAEMLISHLRRLPNATWYNFVSRYSADTWLAAPVPLALPKLG